ncbi:MAG: FAD-linked oxidase C-terminal domain-containing protein, partial [Ktedonobacteraceae bacterium]
LDLAYDEKKKTFNPAKVICGSEGTFGIVVSAKFRLIKRPKKKGFLILRYDSFKSMGDAIPSITKLHPSAAELMDKSVIDAASVLNPQVKDLNKGKLVALIVEFDGDDENQISDQLKQLQGEISKQNKNKSEIITDSEQIKHIWSMREESLGFAYKVREGEKRTEAVIEDTVVPPEKLGEYLEKLEEIYKSLGFDQMSWGHVSEGNIHTRPLVNYKSRQGLENAKKLADEIYSLVSSYGGSSTGEHSDGILRAPYIKVIYNQKMVELFKSVKNIFDPEDLMNPGKKTDALNDSPLRNLRYGENYKIKNQVLTPYPSASTYAMNWGGRSSAVIEGITGRKTSLDFEHEVESCFGCGKCRELSNTSRMCPVYDAEFDEVSACRGRNNLLRWMNKLEGIATSFATTKQYGKAIYENCIQCKMCLVDCPANTDVGKLMAEARARYVKVNGVPKGYKFFFDIDKYANYGCAIAPLSNKLMKNAFSRAMVEKIAGIDRRKNFPPFHRKRFVDRFYGKHPRISPSSIAESSREGYVAF